MKIIYNAFLVDENICTAGAVFIKDKTISGIVPGQFPSKISVTSDSRAAALVAENGGRFEDVEFIDAERLTVMPAFIDMHAHFRFPGQTQKEDLDSALNAAIAGGFGTLVLMPNTSPVISSRKAALDVNEQAAARIKSRVFQSVSITDSFKGTDTSHLAELNRNEIPVVTEDGHDVDDAAVMLEGMKRAAEKGIIVSCHSEDIPLSVKAKKFRTRALELMKEQHIPAWGVFDQASLENVPRDVLNEIKENITEANSLLELAEDIATERNITIAQKAGVHVHIAHVSTVKSMKAVRLAKKALSDGELCDNGFKISCEVTPHHLALCGTEEPKIFAFVNPPLRSERDRRYLIEALRDGTADVISTDHAPHTAEDKAGGSPGFTGLETAYAVCNSILVEQEGFSKSRLSSLMSANPARLLQLNKGLLQKGMDADIVFVNPEEKWIVKAADFWSKGKASPFEGQTLTGRVKKIFIGGEEKKLPE